MPSKLTISLTPGQARVVLMEMETIERHSEDAGYRRQANGICNRLRTSLGLPKEAIYRPVKLKPDKRQSIVWIPPGSSNK